MIVANQIRHFFASERRNKHKLFFDSIMTFNFNYDL